MNSNGNVYYKNNLSLLSAQLLFEKQQFKEALPLFINYVDDNEKVSKEIMYELSYCYYKSKNYSKAIEGFKQLSNEKDSMGQNSMYILGELYLNNNDKVNARTAFQFCASNNSNPAQQRVSRLNYSKLSYELGFQDVALVEIKQYIKDYADYVDNNTPENPSAHIGEAKELMINLLANTNNYDEGLAVYSTLSQASEQTKNTYARLLFGKGIQLLNDQRLTEAEELFTKITDNNLSKSISPYAYYWKGEIAYRQQRYDDAIRFLTIFIDGKFSSMGEANANNAVYTIGYSWFQKNNFKNALNQFNVVAPSLKLTSTSIEQDAYVRAADCNYMMKDLAKASSMYESIAQNIPAQSDYALYQNAIIAGVKNGADKIRLLKDFILKYPNSTWIPTAQMEIALTYIDDEKYMEAVPFLKSIIQSKEASALKPKALLKLGLAYYNYNDNKNALLAYRELLHQYSQSQELEEAVAVIKDIYVEEGNLEEFMVLMQSSNIKIDINEADSLSFVSAYKKFEQNDCNVAVKSLENYIAKFKTGAYIIDANYYWAICNQKLKENSKAIVGFDFVNGSGVNKYFEKSTLELARIYYFENKDYLNAKKYFESLFKNAVVQENKLEALRGLVRCYYQLKDYTTANAASLELLANKGLSTDDKSIASLVLGKSQEVASDTTAAIESFKSVTLINKSAWGAEARYELAKCYFLNGNLSVAEKYAISVIKETGSYDYWVTKSYILLGDIFLIQKDIFNAKATYESVAKNAAIVELKEEAQQKLTQLISEEKKSSKIGN